MAPSATTYPLLPFKVAITLAFIVFPLIPLPKSGAGGGSWVGCECDRESCKESLEERKVKNENGIGSKPPSCANKCLKCSPCVPTLVVPFHSHVITSSSLHYQNHNQNGNDDTYYLLSWKCTCGDKFFQP